MDALGELSVIRKRGQRPVGPVVVTHSPYIARYYRDPNRGMYVVLLGATNRWSALAGLGVLLVDWESEPRHVESGQKILGMVPKFFVTSIWTHDVQDVVRVCKLATVLQ